MCSTSANRPGIPGSKCPCVSEMTPIFMRRADPRSSTLGLFRRFPFGFGRWLGFLGFLFLGFECRSEFHRAGKQPREQTAAGQGVAEELPRLRPTRRAAGQGLNPARDRLRVFGIPERIEE